MTKEGKVTAGPWYIEPRPESEDYAEINGGSRSKARCDWYSFAKVAVRLDGNDSQEGRANLNLIMSAVNACFSIAEQTGSTPQAVAGELPEMVAVMREIIGEIEPEFTMTSAQARALKLFQKLGIQVPYERDSDGCACLTHKEAGDAE